VTWGGRGTAVVARGAVEGAGQETKRGQASAGQSCTGGGGTGLERIKKGSIKGRWVQGAKRRLTKKSSIQSEPSQQIQHKQIAYRECPVRSEHDCDKFSLIRLTFLR